MFRIILVLSLMLFANVAIAKPILVHTTFESTTQYQHKGGTPEITAELTNLLRTQAQAQAEKMCEELFGKYTDLRKSREWPISRSKITLTLKTEYLCGREVSNENDLVPDLIKGFGFGHFKLAGDLLIRIGKESVEPVIAVVFDRKLTISTRVAALDLLGRFLSEESEEYLGNLFFVILDSLIPVLNEVGTKGPSYELVYRASLAYGRFHGSAFHAKKSRVKFTPVGYAVAISGISETWKVGSSYEVEIGELISILKNETALASSYALAALQDRGFSVREFNELLPILGELFVQMDPSRSGMAADLLGKSKDRRIIPYLIRGIDERMAIGLQNQNLLFRIMMAYKEVSNFPEAKDATDRIIKIRNATGNMPNPYIFNLAKQLLEILGGSKQK